MPLTVVFRATLAQTTDTTLASNEEITAFGLRMEDMNECRRELEALCLLSFRC